MQMSFWADMAPQTWEQYEQFVAELNAMNVCEADSCVLCFFGGGADLDFPARVALLRKFLEQRLGEGPTNMLEMAFFAQKNYRVDGRFGAGCLRGKEFFAGLRAICALRIERDREYYPG